MDQNNLDTQIVEEGWVWVTFLGTSFHAITNSIWYAIEHEKLILTKIVCFVDNHPTVVENYRQLEKFLERLAVNYDFPMPEIIRIDIIETNFSNLENKIHKTLIDLQSEPNLALDMTPGRKYMSGLMLHHGFEQKKKFPNIKRLYYLHLADSSYMNNDFPLIPFPLLNLYNFFNREEMLVKRDKTTLSTTIAEKYLEILPESNLLLLLNVLWLEKQDQGELYCKFWNEPILRLRLKKNVVEISRIISKERYLKLNRNSKHRLVKVIEGPVKKTRYLEESIIKEVPTYVNFVELFNKCGILSEKQKKSFSHIFELLRMNAKVQAKAFYLALDTNSLIRKFYSNFKVILDQENLRRIQKKGYPFQVGFFIPPSVEKEISYQINKKYTSREAEIFEKINIQTFFNQPKLKARIFQTGNLELQKLRQYERVLEWARTESRAKGDEAILEEIVNFEKENRPEVYLVTGDETLISSSKARRLGVIEWENKKELENKFEIRWDQFTQLLYESAQLFGSIVLKTPSKIELEGIWKGKGDKERQNKEVKIKITSKRLVNLFKRFLKPLNV